MSLLDPLPDGVDLHRQDISEDSSSREEENEGERPKTADDDAIGGLRRQKDTTEPSTNDLWVTSITPSPKRPAPTVLDAEIETSRIILSPNDTVIDLNLQTTEELEMHRRNAKLLDDFAEKMILRKSSSPTPSRKPALTKSPNLVRNINRTNATTSGTLLESQKIRSAATALASALRAQSPEIDAVSVLLTDLSDARGKLQKLGTMLNQSGSVTGSRDESPLRASALFSNLDFVGNSSSNQDPVREAYNLKCEILEQRKARVAAENGLVAALEEAADVRNENEKLRNIISGLKEKLNSARHIWKSSEIRANMYSEEIKRLRVEYDHLDAESSSLAAVCAAGEAELAKLKAVIFRKDNKITALQNEITGLRVDLGRSPPPRIRGSGASDSPSSPVTEIKLKTNLFGGILNLVTSAENSSDADTGQEEAGENIDENWSTKKHDEIQKTDAAAMPGENLNSSVVEIPDEFSPEKPRSDGTGERRGDLEKEESTETWETVHTEMASLDLVLAKLRHLNDSTISVDTDRPDEFSSQKNTTRQNQMSREKTVDEIEPRLGEEQRLNFPQENENVGISSEYFSPIQKFPPIGTPAWSPMLSEAVSGLSDGDLSLLTAENRQLSRPTKNVPAVKSVATNGESPPTSDLANFFRFLEQNRNPNSHGEIQETIANMQREISDLRNLRNISATPANGISTSKKASSDRDAGGTGLRTAARATTRTVREFDAIVERKSKERQRLARSESGASLSSRSTTSSKSTFKSKIK